MPPPGASWVDHRAGDVDVPHPLRTLWGVRAQHADLRRYGDGVHGRYGRYGTVFTCKPTVACRSSVNGTRICASLCNAKVGISDAEAVENAFRVSATHVVAVVADRFNVGKAASLAHPVPCVGDVV